MVASRPTLDEARVWAQRNLALDATVEAYRAENGWFALVIGEIPRQGSRARMEVLRRSGQVPADSFCSSGTTLSGGVTLTANASAPAPVVSETPGDPLFQSFDARPFSVIEKRAFQAALAYLGYYDGMLDGKWGGGSQAAIEAWVAANAYDEPLGIHVGILALTLGQLDEAGWSPVAPAGFRMGVLFPAVDPRSVSRPNTLVATHGGMTAAWSRGPTSEVFVAHRRLLNRPANAGRPYVVREADLWITSVTNAPDGGTSYLRSDRGPGGTWETVLILAGAERLAELALVASSFAPAPVADLELPTDGAAARLVALALGQIAEWFEADPPQAPSRDVGQDAAFAGTGFYINVAGHVVTNAHVVAPCQSPIEVNGTPARIIAMDEGSDLAILGAGRTPPAFARINPNATRLNADITVAGYPLAGLLSGLSVTRGSISALSGLRGDTRHFRISAPVQAGNSGGPVFNARGEVVGVVVAQLSDSIADSGEINRPQNVNFAIRAVGLADFLTLNGIAFDTSAGTPLSNEALADLAQDVTVQITCQ